MSIPDESGLRGGNRNIASAHKLADLGVPIFTGRLTSAGQPDRTDRRWNEWQKSQAGRRSHAAIDNWKPGLALCAVTGIVYDVLDMDPRNGGVNSLKIMDAELGDEGPELYWEVATPNGGRHFYIETMGIGSHNGFLPGLDLKGGKVDGSGRGFVWIPPTVRLALDNHRRSYRPVRVGPTPLNGAEKPDAFRNWVEKCLEQKTARTGQGRTESDELQRECLAAGPGEQRTALLRYVHELERRGLRKPEILTLLKDLCKSGLKAFNPRDPWYPARGGDPERHLKALFHKEGVVIADATEDEAETLAGAEPIRPAGFRTLEGIRAGHVSWLWPGYLAFHELTMLDGEKGQGKTFIVHDIAARATRGLPMPGQDMPFSGPMKVFLFGDEGNLETVTAPRLIAAGASMGNICIPDLSKLKKKRGQLTYDGEPLALPAGAELMGRIIKASGAMFAIWDPITDFLDESINTNNDASVRRALRPLAAVLANLGVSGMAIRHMNKGVGQSARYRGGGSTAFQNRARVHLVCGRLPRGAYEHQSASAIVDAEYGLAMIDTNLSKRVEGVLCYDVTDSDIELDGREGSWVGRIEWRGHTESMSADALVSAGPKKRGPEATVQKDMIMLLDGLFAEKDTWSAREIEEQLRNAGIDVRDKSTLQKAKNALGVRSLPVRRRGAAGVTGWVWTVRPEKNKMK